MYRVASPHYVLFSEVVSGRTQGDRAAPTGWRFVLTSVDGRQRLVASDVEADASRERLELLAVVRGLEALDQPSRVTLVTGSRYVQSGLSQGLVQWREQDWQWERFGQFVPVANRDLWRRVDRALEFHKVDCRRWRTDGPHVGTPGGVPQPIAARMSIRRRGHGLGGKRSGVRPREAAQSPATPQPAPASRCGCWLRRKLDNTCLRIASRLAAVASPCA